MHGKDSYPASLATGKSPSKDSEIVCHIHSCCYTCKSMKKRKVRESTTRENTCKQYEESKRIHNTREHMYHHVRQCGCSSKESTQFPDGGAQGQTWFPPTTCQARTPDSYKPFPGRVARKLPFLYQTREKKTNFPKVSLSGREEKCRRW